MAHGVASIVLGDRGSLHFLFALGLWASAPLGGCSEQSTRHSKTVRVLYELESQSGLSLAQALENDLGEFSPEELQVIVTADEHGISHLLSSGGISSLLQPESIAQAKSKGLRENINAPAHDHSQGQVESEFPMPFFLHVLYAGANIATAKVRSVEHPTVIRVDTAPLKPRDVNWRLEVDRPQDAHVLCINGPRKIMLRPDEEGRLQCGVTTLWPLVVYWAPNEDVLFELLFEADNPQGHLGTKNPFEP